jgi:hypothetical protein
MAAPGNMQFDSSGTEDIWRPESHVFTRFLKVRVSEAALVETAA